MISASIPSTYIEQTMLSLSRTARVATEHLHAARAQDCPTPLKRLVARVERKIATSAEATKAAPDDIHRLIKCLSQFAQHDVEPVFIDDESCMTAPHERFVPTHRAKLFSAAATSLAEYLEAQAALVDALRAEVMLKDW